MHLNETRVLLLALLHNIRQLYRELLTLLVNYCHIYEKTPRVTSK